MWPKIDSQPHFCIRIVIVNIGRDAAVNVACRGFFACFFAHDFQKQKELWW